MKVLKLLLIANAALSKEDDAVLNMTPGGLPSPMAKRVVKCEKMNSILPEGEWEMILGQMVWTEGPAWWNDQLVFSDTRLGKIFSWDPTTKKVDVVLERSGSDFIDTGVWMEPGSNGLRFNPFTNELLICQHGNRAIAALSQNGKVRKVATSGPGNKPLNSPNDVTIHPVTGDIYFTDPIFGKMTFDANILRGNMHEMPELDNPGFSGVYKIDSKTGDISIIETEMKQPNGIGITPDHKLIVAYCNQTRWEWWSWQLNEDGTTGPREIFIDATNELTGQGYPDGLDIDEAGNVWVTGPGGIYIYNKNGEMIGGEKFVTLATSNIFLAPDGYVYVTGNHGVYRKKRGTLTIPVKEEL